VSVQFDSSRQRYMVRWHEGGRQRTKRFMTREEAVAFDAAIKASKASAGEGATAPTVDGLAARLEQLEAQLAAGERHEGVYAYDTRQGPRWRYVFRDGDGRLSSRRGFTSPEDAAAARRKRIAEARRGQRLPTGQTFGEFWAELLEAKRPYVTAGALEDMRTHGRKRLLPFFGDDRLAPIDETRVRAWLSGMAASVDAGELAPKTVNNARTCLSVALGEALRRGLIPANPCAHVRQLPVERTELDFLRLPEIEAYLDAAPDHYRPLAELLIGTGARISEALALTWPDVDFDAGVLRVQRQRDRQGAGNAQTKGKRFRSVQIGPALVETLGALQAAALHAEWLFPCPLPRRGRYAGRTTLAPPSRKTVHDWHELTLQDAGLRDMPLHALRHTAAAAWLMSGHPLIFVQRQLGHRSITTTEEHYGHLEGSFLRDAAARTEALIAQASRERGR